MKRKLALIESNSKSNQGNKILKAKLANLQDAKQKYDATALKEEVEALKTKLEQKTRTQNLLKNCKDHVSRLQDMRKKMKTLEAKDKEMGDLLQARDEHIKMRDQIQRLKRVVNAAENSRKRKNNGKNNQFSEEK